MELKISNLTKKFKDKVAVDNVNLTLTPGVWGLLGENGAGKTTLIKMIAGIMNPTMGEVCFDKKDIYSMGKDYRNIFGFLTQDFSVSKEFTVKDYLEYVAELKGMPISYTRKQINDLLEILTLSDVRNKQIWKLSGGMRRRVGIAQAMLNSPKVLVLDEPTAGLDPGERVRFRNFISEFSQDRIVLISTHIVSDIEYISTKNAIMKSGKILDVGTTEKLLEQAKGKVWTSSVPARDLTKFQREMRIINQKNEVGNMVSIRYLSDKPEIDNSILDEPRLEDLYLWLFPQVNLDLEVK
ncbi:ATP-binding cassette domain-containing protein [Paraclostridium sp. AKS46]|nr:ATP-binding cassette domain-containing protein [Paraclostridium sp. AKS46]